MGTVHAFIANGEATVADDLIDADEACELLEVAPDRLDAMIEEGLLTRTTGADGDRFSRSEVMALRQLGG